ncbi:MAG TPA: Hsp20/alpha crystallin family protein [Steroidobacteraceae bacterium]|nr:Hsp20/alpha crystallin family protein [Steroidobacteraceae bacterium]
MTIVRYEPWSLVNRLHQSLDQIFGDTLNSPEASSASSVAWVPRVDIHEEKDRFVVLADVPGVEPKDIDITAENGVLTVRGERRSEKRDTENGFERVERVTGTFLRRFTLPEGANTDSIKAKQTNGVLEVIIPKQPQVQPRRISVDVN